MDRTLVKKMRAAMMGKAAVIDEHGLRKSIRSTEVWKRRRLCDSRTELLSQRLKWYQDTVNNQEHNRHLLATWFGRTTFEKKNTVNEDGRITDTANAYARRFVEDMAVLSLAGHEWLDEIKGEVWPIFKDDYYRSKFLAVDPKIVKAAKLTY